MKRRTFLQSLAAIFSALFVWNIPKIRRLAALPQRAIEAPKKIYRFVESHYAERKITVVAQHEILRCTESEMLGRKPKPGEPVLYEVAIVGRVTTPARQGGNIADDEMMAKAFSVLHGPTSKLDLWFDAEASYAALEKKPDVKANLDELDQDFAQMAREYDRDYRKS